MGKVFERQKIGVVLSAASKYIFCSFGSVNQHMDHTVSDDAWEKTHSWINSLYNITTCSHQFVLVIANNEFECTKILQPGLFNNSFE